MLLCCRSINSPAIIIVVAFRAGNGTADFTGKQARNDWFPSLALATGPCHRPSSPALATGPRHWQSSLALATGPRHRPSSPALVTGPRHWPLSCHRGRAAVIAQSSALMLNGSSLKLNENGMEAVRKRDARDGTERNLNESSKKARLKLNRCCMESWWKMVRSWVEAE